MPRAVRQSFTRCSTRSICRRRKSVRNNILSTIRESHRSSPNVNPFSIFRCETPPQPSTPLPPTMPNETPQATAPSTSKPIVAGSVKPMGFLQHGIHYIMMPLHLLHLCVRGMPRITPSSKSDNAKTIVENSKNSDEKISSKSKTEISVSSTNRRTAESSSSTASSSSGFSSASSTSSVTRRRRNSNKVTTTSPSSFGMKSSADFSSISLGNSNYPNQRRTTENSNTSESSDEMLTAGEDDFDDSSNDQWSDAVSTPLTNMSIDHDTRVEKISGDSTTIFRTEEPMDVTVEESNACGNRTTTEKSLSNEFETNATATTTQRKSSFSSTDDRSSIYREFSDSSMDREITRIFRETGVTGSSEDDNRDELDGRRNNALFVDATTSNVVGTSRSGRRYREEICDAVIRKQRNLGQYGRQFNVRVNENYREGYVERSSSSSNDRAIDLSVMRMTTGNIGIRSLRKIDGVNVNNQTDSAYSDDDVDMINDSNVRHQSANAIQESAIEWMDQDLDYVADTEDSNDGSPFPIRPRNCSIGYFSSTNVDRGFVEREGRSRGQRSNATSWRRIYGFERSTMGRENDSPIDGTRTTDWNNDSGLGKSFVQGRDVVKQEERVVEGWHVLSGLERSMQNGHMGVEQNPGTSGGSNEIFGLDMSMPNRQARVEQSVGSLEGWSKISGLESPATNSQGRTMSSGGYLSVWNEITGLDRAKPNRQGHVEENVGSSRGWNEISASGESTSRGQTVANDGGTSLGDWNRISGLDSSTLNGQIYSESNGRQSAVDWTTISVRDDSTEPSNSGSREDDDDNSVDWQASRLSNEFANNYQGAARSPPGFPKIPQLSNAHFCPCGNPNCCYHPFAISASTSGLNLNTNYNKPPTPLRHLYYDYPEFMSPPVEAENAIRESPYVLIPFPANLVCPKLI